MCVIFRVDFFFQSWPAAGIRRQITYTFRQLANIYRSAEYGFMTDIPDSRVRQIFELEKKCRDALQYESVFKQLSLKDGLQQMIDYIKSKGTKKFRYHLDLEIINEKTPRTWKDRLF